MRTALVVLGDRDELSPDTSPDALVVHHRVGALASLPERLTQLHPAGTHVVVVGERRHACLIGRACAMIAAVTGWPEVGRALPHGPLALRLLAEYAGSLDLPPAHVVAGLDAAAACTFSAAWLQSVAKLAAPAPTVKQHLRSLAPGGSGFLVEHAPREGVTAVGESSRGGGDRAAGGAERPAGQVERAVLAVSGTGMPDAALRQAQRLAGTREWVAVPRSEGTQERYGTASAIELVALPAVAPALPRADTVPLCRVCDLPVLQPTCPFCRVSTAPIPLETRS